MSKKIEKEEKKRKKIEKKEKRKQKAKLRNLLFWGGGVVVIALIIYMFSSLIGGASTSSILESDHVKGNLNSENIIIEYSDFECPACAGYNKYLKEEVNIENKDVAFVYRHFPLSFHKHSELAARATEAASAQGKFWDMHDKLFEEQGVWSALDNALPLFTSYAEEFGLDKQKFLKDIESDSVKRKVRNDYRSGMRNQVNSTPTLFLNGSKVLDRNNLMNLPSLEEKTKSE